LLISSYHNPANLFHLCKSAFHSYHRQKYLRYDTIDVSLAAVPFSYLDLFSFPKILGVITFEAMNMFLTNF